MTVLNEFKLGERRFRYKMKGIMYLFMIKSVQEHKKMDLQTDTYNRHLWKENMGVL